MYNDLTSLCVCPSLTFRPWSLLQAPMFPGVEIKDGSWHGGWVSGWLKHKWKRHCVFSFKRWHSGMGF